MRTAINLLLFAVLLVVLSSATFTHSYTVPPKATLRGRTFTLQMPPPTHVEWFSVTLTDTNWRLCRAVGDSIKCVALPDGTTISIPRLVEGVDPGSN